MIDGLSPFLVKAEESLAGAEREFANGAYNNCANRCYYACFQAAIHALAKAGIRPRGTSGQWSHDFVSAQFDGVLLNRRKLYSSDLRNVLAGNYALRLKADYQDYAATGTEASRALRRTRTFIQAVREGEGSP